MVNVLGLIVLIGGIAVIGTRNLLRERRSNRADGRSAPGDQCLSRPPHARAAGRLR